jgi:hypothetical protein
MLVVHAPPGDIQPTELLRSPRSGNAKRHYRRSPSPHKSSCSPFCQLFVRSQERSICCYSLKLYQLRALSRKEILRSQDLNIRGYKISLGKDVGWKA